MSRLRKVVLVFLTALAMSCRVFAGDPAPSAGKIVEAPPRTVTPTAFIDIPLVNWTVPQFFGLPSGVSTSMAISPSTAAAGKTNAKIALDMSVFTAIQPCRLVDTRGFAQPVYPGGGPFAAGEVRTYQANFINVPLGRSCGLPVGANRIKAISIAITTPPSTASGDVETVPHGAPLGSSVDMVAQAFQWNSVSKIVRVDANAQFDLQLRFTFGDVAVDINGYFADVIPGDFYSVVGSYGSDGGLFYVENADPVGAAVRAYNSGSGSDVRLAQGASAIDIAAGQIRVRDAGNNTGTPAFIHQVNAQNLCPDTRFTRLEESNVFGGNAAAGQILFVQEATHTGNADTTTPKLIRASFFSGGCNGAVQNAWFLFTPGAFAVGETYNVLVINP